MSAQCCDTCYDSSSSGSSSKASNGSPELPRAAQAQRGILRSRLQSAQDEVQTGEDGSVREPIPTGLKFAFAAPTVAMLPYVMMFSLYGNTSYESFGATLGQISVYTALARSFDVVSDPLMSYLTDSTRTAFGRRRPYMLVGAFLYSASLLCLQSPPYGTASAISTWFGFAYILYFLANTFTTIPYYALAPELSRDPGERTNLFFLMSIFEGVATLIAVTMPVIAKMVLGAVEWNDWACRPEEEQAALCIAAKTCNAVFTEGILGAFTDNASLAAALGNLSVPADLSSPSLPAEALSCSQRLQDPTVQVLGPAASNKQNELFCLCVSTCDAACTVAEDRSAFQWVGVFFSIWMLVSMCVLVAVVRERPPVNNLMQKPAPLVPALMNTMMNAPFRILLPAWACDSFCNAMIASMTPYFVKVVIQPSYQTLEEDGRDCDPDSAGYASDWLCDSDAVITLTGVSVLTAAIVGLPLWKWASEKFGKVRTWLMWSLTQAITNCLFLVLGKGWVISLWIVAALNGLPLGAKFLADSILSDIIDYDQFLTGLRNEATYFMFKGFLPKIVQIPASAIPIALLATVGYVPPMGGIDQPQPFSATLYVKGVVFTCFIFSMLAYFLKRFYPLKTEEDLHHLRLGIVEHQKNEEYPDPVTQVKYKPMWVDPTLQPVYWTLDHFRRWRLHSMFVMSEGTAEAVPADPMLLPESEAQQLEAKIDVVRGALRNRQQMVVILVVFILCLIASAGGTIHFMDLASSVKYGWVPTITAVMVGLSVVSIVISAFRLVAANTLCSLARSGELTPYIVAQVILHRDLVRMVGVTPKAGVTSRVGTPQAE